MKMEVKEIQKAYGRRQILHGASFEALEGMCVGILGSNGSGKSTLLSILAGIQKADGGAFCYDGRELLRSHQLRQQLVGYVPQGTPFLEELSAWDNLRLWYSGQELTQELETGVLAALGIGEFIKMPVYKLSGGMKKRLSIGCAMASRPPVLLMDEPTAALDLAGKEQIHSYLRQYQCAGGIAVITTHDIQDLECCDRLYILKDGVLTPFTFDGDIHKLLERL